MQSPYSCRGGQWAGSTSSTGQSMAVLTVLATVGSGGLGGGGNLHIHEAGAKQTCKAREITKVTRRGILE